MPELWERIEEVYGAALEHDPEARHGFLAAACGDDDGLRREVESLLAAEEAAGEFLTSPAVAEPTAAPPGRRLGAYRLLESLGSGGTGTVYLAERIDDPRALRVAIKFLRRGLDSEEAVARFHRERRILARLDHPAIARFYDGGTSDDGVPFIVMERVEGLPIDQYCDRHGLTVDERLELFRRICDAVHYAHRNLIVHRDLKPSNILVTAAGVPKLLDFGIAKLLDPDLDLPEATPTASWVRLLTPEYASPEQVRGGAVTTASDVYSLGVLLYRLLAGHLPHRFAGRPLADIERALAEAEPEPPSAACGQAPDTLAAVCAARRSDPQKLRRRLAGDLDLIVAKAMRKEPERRYSSAEQFAEDLRRHLRRMPVLARPDTWAYRTGRFLRRHRTAASLAAVSTVLIVGFAAFVTVQSARLARALDRAEHERDRSQRVLAFVVDLFEVADPSQARGATITAKEILGHGRQQLTRHLVDLPDARAALMDTLGVVYGRLGLFAEAEPLLEEALAIRRGITTGADPPTPDPEVAESLAHLARVRYQSGKLEAAEALLREALAMERQSWEEEHQRVAAAMDHLAEVLQDRGDFDESETLYRQALALRRKLLGDAHPEVASNLSDLGSLLFDRGEHEESEALLRQALAIYQGDSQADPLATAAALNNLAQVRWSAKADQETEELVREVLAIRRRVLGEEHPDVAQALNNLGAVLAAQDRLEEAESLYRDALERIRRTLGDQHPDVPQILYNLGHLLCKMERCDQAEPMFRESFDLYSELLGAVHPRTADPLFGLAQAALVEGRPQAAEPLLRQGLAVWRQTLAPGHWWIARAEGDLGGCLTALGRYAEAKPLLVASYPVIRAQLGDQSRTTRRALQRLVELYEAWGRGAEAEAYRRQLR